MPRIVIPQHRVRAGTAGLKRKPKVNKATNFHNHKVDGTFKKSKRGKYNANGRHIDEHWFASKAEGDRYEQLKELVEQGVIEALEMQPRFPLKVNNQLVCTYIADFRYKKILTGMGRKTLIEDVKGMLTDEYKLKRKLMTALMPDIQVTEIHVKRKGIQHMRYCTADQMPAGA